jgi:hypothetical protein
VQDWSLGLQVGGQISELQYYRQIQLTFLEDVCTKGGADQIIIEGKILSEDYFSYFTLCWVDINSSQQ